MSPQSAWVTGADGLLGSVLVTSLRARGIEVLASGRAADVTDRPSLVAAVADRRPTCIFNAAAYTAVDAAESDRERAFALNADGPAVLGALARELGADLVHFSSDYVLEGTPPLALAEDAVPAPAGVYARSKRLGEERVLATADAAHRVVVIRTSWLFGACGASFVSRMLELMATRHELHVVDDQHGRPTAAGDLAAVAVELGLGRLRELPTGIYHFANRGPTTWHAFACAIRETALRHGLPVATALIHAVPTSAFPRPAPRPRWSVLDCTRLEGALAQIGMPTRSWQEALEEHVAGLWPKP